VNTKDEGWRSSESRGRGIAQALSSAGEQQGNGPVHFAGRAGDVVIELYPLPDDANVADSSIRLGFGVENLAEVFQALQGIGTKIVTPPRETTWGLQAVVRDPYERSVELRQR
jgi:lactoylglutathione lyase